MPSGRHKYMITEDLNVKIIGNAAAGTVKSARYVGDVQAPTFTSSVATGTAPFTVSSTTQVTSLNASQVGGLAATALVQKVNTCGTTTTCSNTAQTSPRIVWGTVALSGGTATVTGITAFTSSSSFNCVVSDTATTPAAASCQNTSSSSITIKGAGTDVIAYTLTGN